MSAPTTLLLDCHVATFDAARGQPYGRIEDAALLIRADTLAWVGRRAELPDALSQSAGQVEHLGGAWVTPGLIDCHTHAVFGGDRADEFALRLGGMSYAEIAAAGGGILGTVAKTAAADLDSLVASALPRLQALAADGVTTIEIKSGYGLTLAAERRMLEAARRVAALAGLTVCTTLLGLHALPLAARGDAAQRAAWIDTVCTEWLPTLHAEGLVDAVDAFCEGIAFSNDECAQLFTAAQRLGVPVKLHADQLSDGEGAALAAHFGALSADHVEYTGPTAVAAMAAAGTIAVLLPAAFLVLGETRKPPVAAFRQHGVPMAVASDLNPGTSPVLSLRLAAALACCQFGLTPEEALAGTTVHAARALGLSDRGMLRAGLRADLAVWRVQRIEELTYWLGGQLLARRMRGGHWAA